MEDDSYDNVPTPSMEKDSISDAERVIASVEAEVKDKEEMIRILLPYARRCSDTGLDRSGHA